MNAYTAVQARLAHLATPVAIAALSVMTIVTVALYYLPSSDESGWWLLWLSFVMGIGMAVAILHQPQRCRICHSQFPFDDGEWAAERHEHSLRWFHRWINVVAGLVRRMSVPFRWLLGRLGAEANGPIPLAAGLVVSVLMIVSAPIALGILIPGPWVGIACNWFYAWLLLVVLRRHRQLRRWCRWCRDGDGDGEYEPEPNPAPGKTVTG